MMKKTMMTLAAVGLALGLVACGGSPAEGGNDPGNLVAYQVPLPNGDVVTCVQNSWYGDSGISCNWDAING